MFNALYLEKPFDHFWMLFCTDKNISDLFFDACTELCSNSLHIFYQIDEKNCKAIEFWTYDESAILDASLAIADRLGVTLNLL